MKPVMKFSRLFICLAACAGALIIPCPAVFEAAYYVSTSGIDIGDGSATSPWKTIQKCANSINGGDTCVIRDGAYPETISATRSGTDGKLLVIKAENARQATVHGTMALSGRYIRIEGFKMVPPAGQNLTVAITGDYNQVANCAFDTPSGTPARNSTALHVGGRYNRVEGNYVQGTCFGITLVGEYNTIERNEVTRLKLVGECGDVDYMRFFGKGHVIRSNSFYGILRSEVNGAHVDCFQTFDNNGPEYSVSNVTIENNFCSDCDQGAMLEAKIHGLSDGLIFRNNVFKNCSSWGLCVHNIKNVRVYNNTFDMTGGIHGMGCRFGASCEVKNNIFFNGTTAYWYEEATVIDGTGGAPGKNNLLYSADRYISGFGGDVTNKDPLFVGRSGNRYALQPGSPAIDAGISIGSWASPKDRNGILRPQGRAWDIGAHEYSATYVSPPSNVHVLGP